MGSTSHVEFRDRVRKTLYYGQYSDRSLPSLAVTGKVTNDDGLLCLGVLAFLHCYSLN